jgi:peptidyl-prolyl cis-trans isomerase C
MSDPFAPVIVGGREIPAATIAAEAQHHPAHNADTAWAVAAEALVVKQLLLDEAQRLGISPDPATDRDGRLLTEEDARIEALLEREVHVPEADEETCRRYYDTHEQCFLSRLQVEAEHILFKVQPDDPIALGLATSDARGAIREIIHDPGVFAKLAQTYSGCPSAALGGQLGLIAAGQVEPAFEAALFALAEGQLCPHPVRSRYGVHVIRAGRRIEAHLVPFEAVRRDIAHYLREASLRRAISQYIPLLAARVGVSGVEITIPEGMLVQ